MCIIGLWQGFPSEHLISDVIYLVDVLSAQAHVIIIYNIIQTSVNSDMMWHEISEQS